MPRKRELEDIRNAMERRGYSGDRAKVIHSEVIRESRDLAISRRRGTRIAVELIDRGVNPFDAPRGVRHVYDQASACNISIDEAASIVHRGRGLFGGYVTR